jgi:hypothetical protein
MGVGCTSAGWPCAGSLDVLHLPALALVDRAGALCVVLKPSNNQRLNPTAGNGHSV